MLRSFRMIRGFEGGGFREGVMGWALGKLLWKSGGGLGCLC